MRQSLEVMAEFKQGMVLPRQIRYYDVQTACYLKKEIREISYQVSDARGTTYGVRFQGQEQGMLRYSRVTGQWEFAEHL